jgi:tRNA-modifying protein YgfZ
MTTQAPLRDARARLTFGRDFWQGFGMKAALLPDRGVVKIAGDDARRFLNGLVTADVDKVTPKNPCFAALLTPQGKIVVDFILFETAGMPTRPYPGADLVLGTNDFFLDCPRALAGTLVDKLNFYKLRAKLTIEDLSEQVGIMAIWDGAVTIDYELCYPDPRLPALGVRAVVSPLVTQLAAADLGAELVDASAYEAHRIALGVPRGGLDFIYGDAFPHETDMDQLAGVDFAKGCFIGQEVVSRIEHRGTARTRIVPVAYEGFAPETGVPVTAGEKPVGTMGSAAQGHGIALLRLDRVADALAEQIPLLAGGIAIRVVKPDWARFAFPGETAAG